MRLTYKFTIIIMYDGKLTEFHDRERLLTITHPL